MANHPHLLIDGKELCPQCDGLSPMLGYRRDACGEIEEYIIQCSLCHGAHMVTVEAADRWRREVRKQHEWK
jgi:hypothetical protein